MVGAAASLFELGVAVEALSRTRRTDRRLSRSVECHPGLRGHRIIGVSELAARVAWRIEATGARKQSRF